MAAAFDRSKANAEVWRTAARIVERGSGSNFTNCACYALWTALGDDHGSPRESRMTGELDEWFGQDAKALGSRAFWGANFDESEEICRDCRVLMLCFMAAMVEAGDA